MRTFTTKVAMRVTEKQYSGDLKYQLIALGYTDEFVYELNDYPFVQSGYGNAHDEVGSTDEDGLIADYFIEGYNSELFLALAAMTEGEDPIVGEYFKCLKGSIMNDEGALVKVTSYNGSHKDTTFDERPSFTSSYSRLHYRKATKEELIEHLSIEKPSNLAIDPKLTGFGIEDSCNEFDSELFYFSREDIKTMYDQCSIGNRKAINIILSGQQFDSDVALTPSFLASIIRDLID